MPGLVSALASEAVAVSVAVASPTTWLTRANLKERQFLAGADLQRRTHSNPAQLSPPPHNLEARLASESTSGVRVEG